MKRILLLLPFLIISCKEEVPTSTTSMQKQEIIEAIPGTWEITPLKIDTARDSKGGSLPIDLKVFTASMSHSTPDSSTFFKEAVIWNGRGMPVTKYAISYAASGFSAVVAKPQTGKAQRLMGQFKDADNWGGYFENITTANNKTTGYSMNFTAKRK